MRIGSPALQPRLGGGERVAGTSKVGHNGRKSVTEGESRWHCDFRLCCCYGAELVGWGGRAPRHWVLPTSAQLTMEGQSFRARVGYTLNRTMGTGMPSAHFSTSSASHPLGTIRWRGGGSPLWVSQLSPPAPEAEDPSLGLLVCAIGLACIFIYFCCCCCSFFFSSRIRDFLIYFNFFF